MFCKFWFGLYWKIAPFCRPAFPGRPENRPECVSSGLYWNPPYSKQQFKLHSERMERAAFPTGIPYPFAQRPRRWRIARKTSEDSSQHRLRRRRKFFDRSIHLKTSEDSLLNAKNVKNAKNGGLSLSVVLVIAAGLGWAGLPTATTTLCLRSPTPPHHHSPTRTRAYGHAWGGGASRSHTRACGHAWGGGASRSHTRTDSFAWGGGDVDADPWDRRPAEQAALRPQL